MIKLSDYLNYLNSEVIQARKQADELAVKTAQEYAKHQYLKYFRVPRFTMPVVKMEIPIKIDQLDSETKFNFKMNEETYIAEVNEKIKLVNEKKGLNLQPISKKTLATKEFASLIQKLEVSDQRFVKDKQDSINKVDFNTPIDLFVRNEQVFSLNESSEKTELAAILKQSIANRYDIVSTKLNEIFIDPDTSKENDKDKVFVKLNVEMVEEGIRINSVKFLKELNALNNKYMSRAYEFDQKFLVFMAEVQEFFQQLGENTNAAELSRLQMYFSTAKKGINPQNLEKLKLGRRDNTWSSAFYCLNTISEVLQIFLEKQKKLLESASEVIEQLVLSLVQSNLISKDVIQSINSLEHIETLWKKMSENEQIDLMNMKLKMSVQQQDIYLLIEKIFIRLR